MSWREIFRWLWRSLRVLDGGQGRRDIREARELQALERERETDPYELAGRAEVDELLGGSRS
jgi:hypothetical protein